MSSSYSFTCEKAALEGQTCRLTSESSSKELKLNPLGDTPEIPCFKCYHECILNKYQQSCNSSLPWVWIGLFLGTDC